MDTIRLSLIAQRWRYFRRGNFHGVSANWLRKKCDGIYSSISEYIQAESASAHFSLDTLKEGEDIFYSTVEEKSGANYSKSFDCEVGLASFLYAYILAEKPLTVVETGVANGITTNSIMRALERTGGTLHSFDIDSQTQNVYKGVGNWHFHNLTGNFEKSLQNQIEEIGDVDLWIHDSNHGFQWQTFEYRLAAKVLSGDGVLVSDDIDSSTAWGISSRTLFKHSYAIFDKRKFIGVAKINKLHQV